MLAKQGKATIVICINIVILFFVCAIVFSINFFTKDSIAKENNEYLKVISIKEEILMNKVKEYISNQKVDKITVAIEKEEDNKNSETSVTTRNLQQVRQSENIVPVQYKGYETIGKIEIPKTKVDIPILDSVTVSKMEVAPCLLYKTGELNKDGNNLIVGHNYRNGTLFSDNKDLEIGDKIYITSLDENRVEYTIYDKFITTAEDTTYIKRDTNNKPEITLSSCTEDDELRIIILAKVAS